MVAGNSGPRTESVENGAPWILTVGASSHDRRARAIVRLANGVELEGESGYQPRSFNFTGLPIVYPGFADQDGTPGCQTFGDVDIKGKIVVCISEDLSLTPREMGINVRNAGGVAMIALSGKRQGSTTFSDDHVLPAIHLNHSLARKIERYFRSSRSPHKAAISFRGTRYGAHPSPTIPYFSGRGPHRLNLNGGILKPDIVGPGVNILSAWPIKPGYNPRGRKGSYFSFQSGTSMATPHLAGVAALLKSSHKKWSPAAIKSAIMTTADRFDHDGNPILDDYHDRKYQADLFAMGSGQVNPTKANDPGLIYDIKPKEYIKYLCGLWSNDTLVTIAARKPVQCSSVGSIAAEQLNYPSISVSLRLATYKSITRTLTNVGDADEIYFIQVEEPEGISVLVSPVILRFTKINQKKKITIRIRSISTSSKVGDTLEGQLMLDSGKHLVRSPISVTIV
ncbi:hypothetical protein J5N97_024482 [Dioscorea zingiberensis]|uniref:Uncharacterized protein n=1 Tax=Dioscorea zingiberensis TaxID=325984 RepID=A0A9D5C711_9LILI|nr:hypothetical protein J5N97_024482 [Dioscorea zingiberensis]